MGLLDSIFGSSPNQAVPGGNLTKPIVIGLLAVLASRALGGSKTSPGAGAPGNPMPPPGAMPTPGSPIQMPGAQPGSGQDLSLGGILGGLGGLLEGFKQ